MFIQRPKIMVNVKEENQNEEDIGWLPEDPNKDKGLPVSKFDDVPIPDSMIANHNELLQEMVSEAAKDELASRSLEVEVIYNRPTHPSFLHATTDAVPPYHNFRDGNPYYFDGVELKSQNYISVMSRCSLQQFYDLENNMTTWYNKFFFDNKMYERQNWWIILVGGFYAAYNSNYDRWVRAWVCDIVYAQDITLYKNGVYDALVYLIDYGEADLIPRRYLLPLRKEDIELPFMSYIAAIQHDATTDFTADEVEELRKEVEKKMFCATICRRQILEDLPFQVLLVNIHRTGASANDGNFRN